MPAEEILVPVVALIIAVFIANWVYDPGASTTLASVSGLIRSGILLFAGLMLLIGNTMFGLFFGMLLVAIAIFLGRGHYDRLPSNDVRSKING